MKDFTFVRILFGVTGIIQIISGVYFVLAGLIRFLDGPAMPRTLTVGAAVAFLLGASLQGICWLILSLNTRFWHRRSE